LTEWIVRRWTRYGHDRLYAEAPDGTPLGFLDLKTNEVHCDDSSKLPLLRQALADYQAAHDTTASAASAAGAAPLVDRPALSSDPEWDDLSQNRPGAGARRRARAERDAAPLRTTIARLLGVRTDERDWRIGADGEEAVAAQLSKLGQAWHVLHAVEVGERGADIDHLVVGPGGVFAVNAKHHPDATVWVAGETFMVNGRRANYVRNSRHEARRVARQLTEQLGSPVAATGVIAVVGAHRGFEVKEQPHDDAVVVLARTRVSQYLRSRPTSLSDTDIAAIYEVARRSTTWR
jgi:hypothetical protein